MIYKQETVFNQEKR